MKKILLTLFAVAAIVIACDKDAYDADTTNINIIEQAEEINATVDFDLSRIEETLNRLSSNIKSFPVKDNTTARTAGGHIRILGGADGSIYYEFAFSDDIEVCNEATYSFLEENIYIVLNAAGNTEVRVGSLTAAPVATLTRDFSSVFARSIQEGISYDFSSGNIGGGVVGNDGIAFGSTVFDFICDGWSFDSATMTWSHPTQGSYIISEAPFPLNGILARVLTQGVNPGTLHYAASGDMNDASDASHALNDAIQRDFGN